MKVETGKSTLGYFQQNAYNTDKIHHYIQPTFINCLFKKTSSCCWDSKINH